MEKDPSEVVYRNPDNPEDFVLADGNMSHAALSRVSEETARARGVFFESPLDGTLWPDDEMTKREEQILVARLRQLGKRTINP